MNLSFRFAGITYQGLLQYVNYPSEIKRYDSHLAHCPVRSFSRAVRGEQDSLSYAVQQCRRISASSQFVLGRAGSHCILNLAGRKNSQKAQPLVAKTKTHPPRAKCQHPHYRAAFRAAATCVTRVP